MKERWIKMVTGIIKNRKGYSSVLLAMVFVTFAFSIVAAISICRIMVIGSECESYGRVWARAILSEYDEHLLEDYDLMAYFGNEPDVDKRIAAYAGYSMEGRLGIRSLDVSSELTGYELGDPENFRKAMKKGITAAAAEEILLGNGRSVRGNTGYSFAEGEEGNDDDHELNRTIGNKVVLDTLPSNGIKSSVDAGRVLDDAKSTGSESDFRSGILGAGTDIAFIWKHFGNNVTTSGDDKCYFRNEWEYIISGKPSDKDNYDYCRTRLFIIRNGLDLVSLYRDTAKVEMIISAAEIITPGPLATATQLLISEAWAALEAESDLKSLYEGGRVPLIKSPDEWQTDLGSVLESDKVKDKLDEESKELLDENSEEIHRIAGSGNNTVEMLTDGLDYDEHLMMLMLAVNENTRLLRIMDIVQINMKYRYYRDFNLMEYHTGVRFCLSANGRKHDFEDYYK